MSNSYTLHNGDCLDIMPTLAENSVDTIITDPPYGLEFMGKDWDKFGATSEVASEGADKSHPFRDGTKRIRYGYGARASYNFQSFMTDVFAEALRVAKPGAMLLAFGGTRTFHRLAVAIEDAGWEIRDTLMWVYGSGFPKSHDISKAIDKAAGAERETVGTIKKTHIGGENGHEAWRRPSHYTEGNQPVREMKITAPATDAARTWDGYGTALKPAFEPIILAMKPLDGTFAANALEHGVAGLWIDGGRVETVEKNGRALLEVRGDTLKPEESGHIYGARAEGSKAIGTTTLGRWPANLIHDGSDEVTGLFPVTGPTRPAKATLNGEKCGSGKQGMFVGSLATTGYTDTGSAARFFYCAKASRSERNAGLEQSNHHPTVKPLALMRYLAKLTRTPSGGVVLDPFMGSGSTGAACMYEGRDFIGIEQDEEYTEIARRRIEHHRQEAVKEQRQPALFEGMNGQQAGI